LTKGLCLGATIAGMYRQCRMPAWPLRLIALRPRTELPESFNRDAPPLLVATGDTPLIAWPMRELCRP
jgi:hypothetical protein